MSLDVSSLSLTQKDLFEFSGAVFEAVFQNPALTTTNQVFPGIKAKTQIVILGTSSMSGQKLTDCSIGTGPTIPSSEKWWDPEEIGDRYVQCYKDLEESFVVWGLNCGIRKADLSDTDFAAFMIQRVGESAWEAYLRISWFGDTAADNVSNGGVITNGVDPLYFSALDGFWKQLYAITTSDPDRLCVISQNAGASYAAQQFTEQDAIDGAATNYLACVKYNADYRLRDRSDIQYLVTQSIFDEYAKELRIRNVDASFVRIEGGYQALMFEGIPVIPMNVWDRNIRANMDNGTTYDNPHRILLSVKSNLGVGVCTDGELTSMDSFYDRKDRTYYNDYAYTFDVKVIEDYMVQVGS